MNTVAKPCIFCRPDREILAQNERAIAVFDKFPVSPGHALVLPRRHVASIWELEPEEYAQCFALVRALKPLLDARFRPEGYNIGVNQGEVAGQSVWHAHVHVIPRYRGDNPDPLGGVRNVIPRKGRY
ncbi:MAG: HIT family protein [Betaproteobacteria bacterium]|nr:HIT family protein [Betaproteobacteria bacterium]